MRAIKKDRHIKNEKKTLKGYGTLEWEKDRNILYLAFTNLE